MNAEDVKSIIQILKGAKLSERVEDHRDEDGWGPSASFAARAAKKHNAEINRLIRLIDIGPTPTKATRSKRWAT